MQLEKKMRFYPGTQSKFPPILLNFPRYCLISLHFFMYFFILEVKIPSKYQNFLGTRPEFPIFLQAWSHESWKIL